MSNYKNVLLACLFSVFCIFSSVKADDFVNKSNTYYLGVTTELSVFDAAPGVSDSLYFGISFPGDMSYRKISAVKAWGRTPSTVTINYTPDTICNYVKIGVFTNPNGVWSLEPSDSFLTNFVQSNGQFISVPDTIYNAGTYRLLTKFNVSQLPKTISLQYKTVTDSVWRFREVLPVTDTINYRFVNTFLLNDVVFRYVYNNTNIVIASSDTIDVLYRNTYFRFKTFGGQKNQNDVATIVWEKSSNFPFVLISVYANDTLVDRQEYTTDNLLLNFTKRGIYKVVGVVESSDFRFEQSIVFEVGDPCDLLRLENIRLNDSLNVISKTNIRLTNELNTKIRLISERDSIINRNDSIIRNDRIAIERLNRFIKDSSTLQLVYDCRYVTEVQDTVYSIDVETLVYRDEHVILPDIFQNDVLILIFTVDGSLRFSSTFSVTPKALKLGLYPAGAYYIWLIHNDERHLYKFIKI